MPQRKSPKKRLNADKIRKQRNLTIKSKVKKATKKFLKTVEAGNLDEANQLLKTVYRELDKSASKKHIHKNKASRQKSRLTKKISRIKKS